MMTWTIPITRAFLAQRPRRLLLRRSILAVLALALLSALGWVGFVWQQAVVVGSGMGWFTQHGLRPLGLALLMGAWLVYWVRVAPPTAEGATSLASDHLEDQLRPNAWMALEQALELAESLQRPIAPAHVVLGAFVTTEGASILARLGISFDALQEPFVPLLRAGAPGENGALAPEVAQLLEQACALARQEGRGCGAAHLVRACLAMEPAVREAIERAGANPQHIEAIVRWLTVQAQLKSEHDAFVRVAAMKPDTDLNRTMTSRQTLLLNQISEDLTRLAKQGYIAPMVQREEVWAACSRAWESGARVITLVGPEGSGKTSFIEALARRMVEERVPAALFDRRLVSVHVQELVTGADSGQISERVLQLLNECAASGNLVLVLEGVEALVGAGYGGTHDLLDTVSQEIERYGLFVIATTTPEAWTSFIERRPFAKRAVKVDHAVPTTQVAEAILMTHANGFEYKHGVFFSYAALEVALRMGATIATGVGLPANALGWIREAAASVQSSRGARALVTQQDVAKIIEEKTGIPATSVQQDEAERLLGLEARLQERVIGQEAAVQAVAQAMRRARADIRDQRRPIATFLFLGPTGVGKTELAKALAAEYFGAEDRMVRIDCSEYQQPSSVARLIGAPQDDRGGLLTEALRQKPYTLLLLDELEKAHPDILTLFLQLFDDGRLTDGVGRTIDATHTIVIATSNAAAPYIRQRVQEGASADQLRRELLERELAAVFRPEFLNRFDGVEVFHSLTVEHMTRIAWILLRGLERRLEQKGIHWRAADEAVEQLAKEGYDPEFGARPLRRLLQDRLETAIADKLLRNEVRRGDTLVLDARGQLQVQSG